MRNPTESIVACRRFCWCGLLVIGPGSAGALADGPALRIEWSVNGGELNVYYPKGVDEGMNTYSYEGTTVDEATSIELSYDLVANPYESVGGSVEIYNTTEAVLDVEVDVILPFTPNIDGGSELSADVTIVLTTDSGGGMIGSRPPYLWQATIDGAAVGPTASLFYDPFFMTAGGQASASTYQFFGYPEPVPGPPVTESIGYSLKFALTPLDLGGISSTFNAEGNVLTCLGDLNASGVVGPEDLYQLLTAWGPCQSPVCEPDLDGNIEVGIMDMLIMLTNWGPCQ